ncbi:MAG: histidinol dehydrogenase [Cyanobacteriota bacterium]|nr:histidinol dehydrogenase [Cyanobacteriota bacterium]
MLRIITTWVEVRMELRRIKERAKDDMAIHREATVREVLHSVRVRGDNALLHYTAQFDQIAITEDELRVKPNELDAAYLHVNKDLLAAIRSAIGQIEAFHRLRVPSNWVHFGEDEIVLGKRYTPVDAAGLYVPGGQAAYPSMVLMSAIPARIAKVPRIVMVTPPGLDKKINPAVLVAAQEAGVSEIYRVGGAQAIAALAYGTQTVPKVDVVVGPGNIYVTLAKKIVGGMVGIDCLAGPSETIIIADRFANPVCLAADILAAVECDSMAAAILLTEDSALARQVVVEVERQLANHPRRTLVGEAIANYGLVAIAESLEAAVELSNEFAPGRLRLEVEEPWDLLEGVRHAGAIFLGRATPDAVGNYFAGPNQILPTSGGAGYSSPLGVETFMKHSSLVQYSPTALQKVAKIVDILATAEGLPSHADSVRFRTRDSWLGTGEWGERSE